MAKNRDASAMEIDDPKSTNSDQISPKFSINGKHFAPVCSDLNRITEIITAHFHFLLVVKVLQLLKSAQMQHGLRHGDYTRYRYCYSFLGLVLLDLFCCCAVEARFGRMFLVMWFETCED